MPSPFDTFEHLADVRLIMAAAGFAEPGEVVAKLTADELREQELGRQARVSAQDVAEEFIARRRIAMGSATVAA